jgi:hypothetical protein
VSKAPTISRTTADGVRVTELATLPSGRPAVGQWPPAAPPSAPTPLIIPPAQPAPPVVIPDGEPADVALRLLAAADPKAAAGVRERLELLHEDLALNLLERTRLGGMELTAFVALAAAKVELRRVLEARLAGLTGRPAPDRPSPAAEVHALVLSIRGWSDGAELRRHRAARAARALQELAAVEADLRATLADVRSTRASDPNSAAHMRGMVHPQDVWVDLVTSLLARRCAIRARLEALGEDPPARAASVGAAVDAVGVAEVAQAIAGSMPVCDRVGAIEGQAAAITRELSQLDPDTRKAAELLARRGELDASRAAAAAATDGDRKAAAGELIGRAIAGDPATIAELERLVRGKFPALADALAATRGGDDRLVATVAELLRERERQIEDEATRRAVMSHRPLPRK